MPRNPWTKSALRGACAIALFWSASAWSANGAHIHSPADDYIGAGQEYRFGAETTFTVSHPNDSTVTVNFDDWRTSFRAPRSQQLTPGNYESAQRTPFASPPRPGLEVSHSSNGCNKLDGWFEVHEVEFSGNTVVKFAVDFQQHCDGGPELWGSIRINSTVPVDRPEPVARSAINLVATEGEPVSLDGTRSFARSAAISSYTWSQVSGDPVTLVGVGLTGASFIAPDVPPGGNDLVVGLTVTDTAGRQDTVNVNVHVFDSTDLRSRATLIADTYDYLGQGRIYTYDEADTDITAADGVQGVQTLSISGLESWQIRLAPPLGSPLAVGIYADARESAHDQLNHPGIFFIGEGRACHQGGGWYEVVDIQTVGPVVLSLAVDFRQGCLENPGQHLFGSLRYNSSVPLFRGIPYALAGADAGYQEGMPITLDGSPSWSPGSEIVGYHWTQTAGPAASIAEPFSAVTSIVPPAIPVGGATMTFDLAVEDADGLSRTDSVTIEVHSKFDPQTYLLSDSDPGDFVGSGYSVDGRNVHFTSDDYAFAGGPGPYSALRLTAGTIARVDMSGTNNAPITVGAYENAKRFATSTNPGLEYSQEHRGCNVISGRFDVLQLAYAPDNSVDTAAIDLEQHCEDRPPAAFARWRVGIAPAKEVTAEAGPDRYVTEGSLVQLNGSGSIPGTGAIVLSHSWTQFLGPVVALSGANTAYPTFTAPMLPAGQNEVLLRLALFAKDSAGFKDRDVVAIRVVADATDSDGDGTIDSTDDLPLNASEQVDTDGDGVGDNADGDDDNDGVADASDAFPKLASESADLDSDGIGDNTDPDEDGDGSVDSMEGHTGGDGNSDGIADERQPNVVTIIDLSGAYLTAVFGPGVQAARLNAPITQVRPFNFDDLPAQYQSGDTFMWFRFVVPRGSIGDVTLIRHVPVQPRGYVMENFFRNKYYEAITSDFFDFPVVGGVGAEILPDRIVLHLKDGGFGDRDGLTNGRVEHIGAPAWPAIPDPDDGGGDDGGGGGAGGGGGSLSSGLLAIGALVALLRRRKQQGAATK